MAASYLDQLRSALAASVNDRAVRHCACFGVGMANNKQKNSGQGTSSGN